MRKRTGGVEAGNEGKKNATSEEEEKAGGSRKNLKPTDEEGEGVGVGEAGSRKKSRKLRWVMTSDSE